MSAPTRILCPQPWSPRPGPTASTGKSMASHTAFEMVFSPLQISTFPPITPTPSRAQDWPAWDALWDTAVSAAGDSPSAAGTATDLI